MMKITPSSVTNVTTKQRIKETPVNTNQTIIGIPEVAIVIAGRNSEKFLEECIRSALSQSVSCEVVYSDDCSNDASVHIASKFIDHGLKIIPHGIHSGVCATRNRGALATKAPWIIFLDSDDKLCKDYAKTMLMDVKKYPDAPFVYPSTLCFGDSSTFWKNLEWSKYDKWRQNQVSTTSMWNRKVFMAAGMWLDYPTMWDYSLALRCSCYGTPIAGQVILDYRIHDASQSIQLNERLKVSSIPYQEMIRRSTATIGIGSLVSGRIPELFPRWISRVACSVRYLQDFDKQKRHVRLFLLLHSEAQKHLHFYISEAAKYADTLTVEFGFIHDRIDLTTEYARRHSVCRLLANACQRIQDVLSTDIVWLIEDDIVVPLHSCHALHQALTAGDDPPIGVSGCYYNRHKGLENQLLGGWLMNDKHCEPTTHFRPLDVVDFVGTGCLMYWPYRPGSPALWEPICKIENTTAHDWAWSEKVKGTLVMVGSVDCDHHISLHEKV